MQSLAVYAKQGLPFAQDLYQENSADSYLCFPLSLLHSVSYFIFLYRPPSSSLCMAFYSISSNIDEVSINMFVFGDFNIHYKESFTYSGGTDRSGVLCYNFSNDLTQMVNFPTCIPDCDSHNSVLLNLFVSSDASICSTMGFPLLGNSDHVFASVSTDFPSYSKWYVLFHRIAYGYSRVDWDDLHDHLRCSMGGYL